MFLKIVLKNIYIRIYLVVWQQISKSYQLIRVLLRALWKYLQLRLMVKSETLQLKFEIKVKNIYTSININFIVVFLQSSISCYSNAGCGATEKFHFVVRSTCVRLGYWFVWREFQLWCAVGCATCVWQCGRSRHCSADANANDNIDHYEYVEHDDCDNEHCSKHNVQSVRYNATENIVVVSGQCRYIANNDE